MRFSYFLIQKNGNALHFSQNGPHFFLFFFILQGWIRTHGTDPIGIVLGQHGGSFGLGQNGFTPRGPPFLGGGILHHHHGQMKTNKENGLRSIQRSRFGCFRTGNPLFGHHDHIAITTEEFATTDSSRLVGTHDIGNGHLIHHLFATIFLMNRFTNEILLKGGIFGTSIDIELVRPGRRQGGAYINGHSPIRQIAIIRLGGSLGNTGTGQGQGGGGRVFVSQGLKGIFPFQHRRGSQAFLTGGYNHVLIHVIHRFFFGNGGRIQIGQMSSRRNDQITIIMMIDRFPTVRYHHYHGGPSSPHGIFFGCRDHFHTTGIQRLMRHGMIGRGFRFIVQNRKRGSFGASHGH
mmetsp:Transcript_39941/g.83058  ORF Transcript_39941/g.83058 Transcript_39941/m.83058 type:complete len:347 (-) Transcript_39941:289-1329(-)